MNINKCKIKPSPEIGLQIIENVTVNSINEAQQQQSEIYKDASNLARKISGFFKDLGTVISDTIHKYMSKKSKKQKIKIAEDAKNFGESHHPTISNAANTAIEAIKTFGNAAVETSTKIAQSEPVQNLSQQANEKYQEVMNPEAVKNLSKKAEEQYISLKVKAIEKFGNNSNPNPNPQA